MSENSLANLAKGRVGRSGPNKATASVKQALQEAFDELGGVAALVKWGKSDPGAFYGIWSKMLPAEIKADVNVTDERSPAERLEAVVALLRAAGKTTAETAQDVDFKEQP
ncbi:hypothetical protein QCE62_05595 [Caballeronia sp. LZ033]|uniref:hypothetical protein n=1 Tax=Caballeronia sp. LZ033 TaxID=3038566 RepID=UPI002867ADC9|nr:hypothetical protein [Caballeronia sp. LZ033]MDR5813063.1 hypothetical protein [Caballeronia sp. LZ033]